MSLPPRDSAAITLMAPVWTIAQAAEYAAAGARLVDVGDRDALIPAIRDQLGDLRICGDSAAADIVRDADLAARTGAGLICPDVRAAARAGQLGIAAERVLVRTGPAGIAAAAQAGWAILVDLADGNVDLADRDVDLADRDAGQADGDVGLTDQDTAARAAVTRAATAAAVARAATAAAAVRAATAAAAVRAATAAAAVRAATAAAAVRAATAREAAAPQGSAAAVAREAAVAAVCAWLGASVIRTRHVTEIRRSVEMTESILGRRPPAGTLRGLA
jgi:hypothetical protein